MVAEPRQRVDDRLGVRANVIGPELGRELRASKQPRMASNPVDRSRRVRWRGSVGELVVSALRRELGPRYALHAALCSFEPILTLLLLTAEPSEYGPLSGFRALIVASGEVAKYLHCLTSKL